MASKSITRNPLYSMFGLSTQAYLTQIEARNIICSRIEASYYAFQAIGVYFHN